MLEGGGCGQGFVMRCGAGYCSTRARPLEGDAPSRECGPWRVLEKVQLVLKCATLQEYKCKFLQRGVF